MRLLLSLCFIFMASNCYSTSFTIQLGSQTKLLFSLDPHIIIENLIYQTDHGISFSRPTTIGLTINNYQGHETIHELMPLGELPIINSVISTGPSLSSNTIMYLRSLNWMDFVIYILENFHASLEPAGIHNDKHRVAVLADGLKLTSLNCSIPVVEPMSFGATNLIKTKLYEKQTDL